MKFQNGRFDLIQDESESTVVFEGTLSNGIRVAVKRLVRLGQGKKGFFNRGPDRGKHSPFQAGEMLGFCAERSHKLLVYECMSIEFLDNWTYKGTSEDALEWVSDFKSSLLNLFDKPGNRPKKFSHFPFTFSPSSNGLLLNLKSRKVRNLKTTAAMRMGPTISGT
ncbi:hypothetical protein RJ640_013382 [Escallonia rubra]|uniref:Uncharacterized protein n=1 Tax=Escallonia rubra TaxID=112253 RepID=A0AA88RSV5_9ASTE|nr:hypothetical protein RJ640_013382 [Escallonia rubra]